MQGIFTMEDLITQTAFQVDVPEFHLVSPGKKN
jgi:uncharacterized protein affecting Mg2+/Co2+ transport